MSSVDRKAVLDSGVLEIGSFQFAGDKPGTREANNKLNFDHLFERKNEMKLRIVARSLGRVAAKYNPDVYVSIPSGGDPLADAINLYSGQPAIPVVHLVKTEPEVVGTKSFQLEARDEDIEHDNDEILYQAKRAVIVDDAFTKLTSLSGVLSIDAVAERAVAAIAIWDRGNHPSRVRPTIPTEALVSEYIPRILPADDELYSHGAQVNK